jgi:hypothetical protein
LTARFFFFLNWSALNAICMILGELIYNYTFFHRML